MNAPILQKLRGIFYGACRWAKPATYAMVSLPMKPFPFHLRSGEEPRQGFARVLGEITAQMKASTQGDPLEAVHEARLQIKLLRSLAWFVRPALNKKAWAEIKARLKAAADSLAGTRDAAVAGITLKNLGKKVRDGHAKADFVRTATTLQRELSRRNGKPVRESLVAAGGQARRAVVLLLDALKESKVWPDLLDRLHIAFRTTRKAGRHAHKTGKPDDFHMWRKKAKRLLFLLRVMETNSSEKSSHALGWLDQLQSMLGDHHDLVVLEGHLRSTLSATGSTRRVRRHLRAHEAKVEKKIKRVAKKWRSVRADAHPRVT
jgi:CHAD domain-containing protein